MIVVLGGLADVERDLLRGRKAEAVRGRAASTWDSPPTLGASDVDPRRPGADWAVAA